MLAQLLQVAATAQMPATGLGVGNEERKISRIESGRLGKEIFVTKACYLHNGQFVKCVSRKLDQS